MAYSIQYRYRRRPQRRLPSTKETGTTFSPNTALAVGSTVAPTVVLGSITVAPTACTAAATGVNPGILGVLELTPATVATATANPGVILGSITTSPTALSAVAAIVDPEVVIYTLVPLTLRPRSANLTVDARSANLTVRPRSTTLTMSDRDK